MNSAERPSRNVSADRERPRGLRRLIFIALAATLSFAVSGAVLFAADLYAHHRASRTAGLNVWGYRGPVAGSKQPGEVRLAFLGGSTLFGYGVAWNEAIPPVVERQLRSTFGGSPPVSAINLGYNNEGAYSFLYTLQDYEYLDYDVVVLYEGYNDLGDPEPPNTAVFRRQSGVFNLTGYFPILPLVLTEKAMALRTGGNLAAGYEAARGGSKTVFTAPLAHRASAAALESLSRVTDSLGRQLGRLTHETEARTSAPAKGCAYPWTAYCESMFVAVTHARAHGKLVAVVTQPRLLAPVTERHVSQQTALREMLSQQFSRDAGVTHIDMSDAVDLANPAFCYDGMHLTVDGNARVGEALARALVPVIRRAQGAME